MNKNIAYHLLTIFFLLFLVACHSGHDSSKDKYKKLTLDSTVEVVGKEIVDKTGYIHWETKSGEKFFVKKKWDESKEQSCKSCHEGHDLRDIKGEDFKRSHWNIKLEHASAEIMNCQTCHNNNDVWLFNYGKKAVTVDRTAKLCSQCHFQQKSDWVQGSHGKRLSGWQYERAITNCISCHNPHTPSFKKRWPTVAPYRPINNEERL